MTPSPTGASAGSGPAPRSFHDELGEICGDPGIWSLAVRRAGSFDLAEDALQDTFYAVARVQDPERIENLRSFFCKALIRQIGHLRGQLAPLPVADIEGSAGDRHQRAPAFGSAPLVPVDDDVIWHLRVEEWLERLRLRHQEIWAAVPERSSVPGRYRDVIVAVAEEILRAGCDGQVSSADFDQALGDGCPDWFDEPGCARDTHYQRLSRGRRDVRDVLKAVVSRDELSA